MNEELKVVEGNETLKMELNPVGSNDICELDTCEEGSGIGTFIAVGIAGLAAGMFAGWAWRRHKQKKKEKIEQSVQEAYQDDETKDADFKEVEESHQEADQNDKK